MSSWSRSPTYRNPTTTSSETIVGRPGPRTVALRTRILEVIAAAEQPLPTPEIFVRLADAGRYCNGLKSQTCPDWAGRAGGIYYHCPAWCWETPGPLGPQVRPQLAALERTGLIRRVHYPNPESIMRAVDEGTLVEHIASARPGCAFWQSVQHNDEYFNAAVDAG